MIEPISFRAFETSYLDQVLELMRLTLGETEVVQRTKDLFSWKHLENPFGESIMLLALSGGEVVGFRALMRWELTTPMGQTIRCARPVDTATHPRFQRRGIFRELTLLALEIARGDGIDLIFNTPNAKSGAGYRSMGWTEVGKIRVQARPTRRLLLGPAQGRSPANGQVSWVDHIGSIDLPDREPIGLRTPREAGYRRWRFEQHPFASYLTVGDREATAVLRLNVRNGRTELVISDLYGHDLVTALKMVRALSHRANYLIASFPDGSPERAAVLSSGLYRVPWISALDLHAYPLAELPVDPTELGNWDIGLGDLELL